jgi:hypothetical protein
MSTKANWKSNPGCHKTSAEWAAMGQKGGLALRNRTRTAEYVQGYNSGFRAGWRRGTQESRGGGSGTTDGGVSVEGRMSMSDRERLRERLLMLADYQLIDRISVHGLAASAILREAAAALTGGPPPSVQSIIELPRQLEMAATGLTEDGYSSSAALMRQAAERLLVLGSERDRWKDLYADGVAVGLKLGKGGPSPSPDPRLLEIAGLVNSYHNDGTTLTAAQTLRAIADALGSAMDGGPSPSRAPETTGEQGWSRP